MSRHKSGTTPAIKSLQSLKVLQKIMEQQRAQEKKRAQEIKRAQQQHDRDHHLFEQSVGSVQRLRPSNRVVMSSQRPSPIAHQRQIDEQQALHSSLSDEFDVSSLLETDDTLSFRRSHVSLELVRQLRQGRWSIQAQLDLHGLRLEEARVALSTFIRTAHKNGLRCVRIIHGKGLGSPGKTPVLKSRVHSWLVQKNHVLAFVQAKPAHGGAGALLVLLSA